MFNLRMKKKLALFSITHIENINNNETKEKIVLNICISIYKTSHIISFFDKLFCVQMLLN